VSLLEVKGLKVAYGGIQAVRGIDLVIEQGELVCLIGANGAGKSSALKGLIGLVQHHGEVRFTGERLNGLPTHAIVAKGMTLVPEGRGIFARLSVAENLDMGAYTRRDVGPVRLDLNRVYDLFSHVWPSAGRNWPVPCPAASSRCWLWVAPSWPGPGCYCWTNPAWA